MTKEQIKVELKHRIETLRPQLAAHLKEAAELGDIGRENFPFDAAEEKIKHNESRISYLKILLRDLSNQRLDKVAIGSTVELRNLEDNSIRQLTVISSASVSPKHVTTSSPLGKLLLDKKVGEKLELKLPNGRIVRYLITALE